MKYRVIKDFHIFSYGEDSRYTVVAGDIYTEVDKNIRLYKEEHLGISVYSLINEKTKVEITIASCSLCEYFEAVD